MGAIQLGLTNPIWNTVETCWKTQPHDRLTVIQVLGIWEKEIHGGGLPVEAEQGEQKFSWITRNLRVKKKSELYLY